MRILRLGANIGQTVKNIGRIKAISTVMMRHGLAGVAGQLGLRVPKFAFRDRRVGARAAATLTLAQRLRMCFEELGPTFVKLGQLLSMRPDLIPVEFVQEFQKLQDTATPFAFSQVREVIEAEIGNKLEDAFPEFTHSPVAAASIAQVHRARLKDNTAVAVKVRRPNIEKTIEGDVQVLYLIAHLLDRTFPELQFFNFVGIVDEFAKTIRRELNFTFEANYIERIAKNFEDDKRLKVPKVFLATSTKKVLTLEEIDGVRVSEVAILKQKGIDPKTISHIGAQVFYKMILLDGLFHGDLHSGNIFVVGPETIALVDFGIVGYLPRKVRDAISNLFIALLEEDYETLTYEISELGIAKHKVNLRALERDIRDVLEPYFGLRLRDVNIGRILMDITLVASKHSIRISRDVMLLSRALLTLDSTGRMLNPDLVLLDEMTEFAKQLVRERYNAERLIKDFFYLLRDVNEVLKVFPKQFRQIMHKVAHEQYTIPLSLEGMTEQTKTLSQGKVLQAVSLVFGATLVSAAIFITAGTPPLVLNFSLFGMSLLGFSSLIFLFFILLVWKMKK